MAHSRSVTAAGRRGALLAVALLIFVGLMPARAQPAVAAQPVIEGGVPVVGARQSVAVSFTGITGTPNQVRWRWGAPPTDAASDSPGWVPFAPTLNVPVSEVVRSGGECVPATLYTQVRNTTALTVGSPGSAGVTFDNGVQAAVTAENPNRPRPATFTPIPDASLADGGDGASDGDPGYTRFPIFFLAIEGAADCSGVAGFRLGTSAATLGAETPAPGGRFVNLLAYPGPMQPGANALVVRVRDNVGNVVDRSFVLRYDPVKPALEAGTLAVSANNPRATVLADLDFAGVRVTDNLYPGGFWGVWVANSREPAANPLAAGALNWTPLKVEQPSTAFGVRGWDLRRGLAAAALTPGDYYVYVRFLDGAGNPTDGYVWSSVTLRAVSAPAAYLPLVRR